MASFLFWKEMSLGSLVRSRGTFQPANLPTFGGDIAETFGASAGEQTKAGLGIPKKFMGQRENLSKDPFEHGIFEGYL